MLAPCTLPHAPFVIRIMIIFSGDGYELPLISTSQYSLVAQFRVFRYV